MSSSEIYNVFEWGVKIVATGLLSLLWWDVRKVRTLKDVIKKEVKEDFILRSDCKQLRSERDLAIFKALTDAKKEIIQEIKNNKLWQLK